MRCVDITIFEIERCIGDGETKLNTATIVLNNYILYLTIKSKYV